MKQITRKLLEMNCILLAQTQMMQEELIALAQKETEAAENEASTTVIYHTDVRELMKNIRKKQEKAA